MKTEKCERNSGKSDIKRGRGKLQKGKKSFCQFRQDKFPRNASEWKDRDFLIVKLCRKDLNRTE